jgi:hypothetical protein
LPTVIELFDRSRRNKESLWSPSHKLFAPTFLIWQKACLLWAVLVSEWLKLKGYFLLKLQVKLFCFGTNKILSSSQKILG